MYFVSYYMKPQISLDEYKAVLEQTILNYLDQALDAGKLSPEKIKEIIIFADDQLMKVNSIDDFFTVVEKIKGHFPELKKPIETAVNTFEEHKKYKIA